MSPEKQALIKDLLAAAVLVGLLLLGGGKPGAELTQVVGANPDTTCPQSLDQWTAWRDAQIQDLLTPTLTKNGQKYLELNKVAAKANATHWIISNCAERYPAQFQTGAPVTQSLANLKRFSQAVGIVSDKNHLFGFAFTDLDYLNRSRAEIEVPELLRSQAFLERVSNLARYQEAQQMIEAENKKRAFKDRWLVLLYKSQFLTSPDNTTYGRFFIYVPGDPAKWIQFAMVTPDMEQPPTIHSMSLVAVKSTGDPVKKSEFYLVDYWRVYGENGIELPTRLEAGHGTADCYYCHKMGVLPIYPLEEYTFDQTGRLVVKTEGIGDLPRHLNELIPDYGPANFGEGFDPEAYGPPLGPFERQRSDDFLQKCTQPWQISETSFDELRTNMNCTTCHNSTLLGPINYPQAVPIDLDVTVLVHPKTGQGMPINQVYVENGWMPPSNDLSESERQALANCLMTEYYDPSTQTGLLVDWLKNDGGREASE
jgi:hypothetical protein